MHLKNRINPAPRRVMHQPVLLAVALCAVAVEGFAQTPAIPLIDMPAVANPLQPAPAAVPVPAPVPVAPPALPPSPVVVSPPSPASPATISPPAPPPVPTVVVTKEQPISKPDEPQNSLSIREPSLTKSIFFTQDQIIHIRDAIIAYEKFKSLQALNAQTHAKDFLSQLDDAKKNPAAAEKNFLYPQFYLQSLVYHSPTDWSVQVNDRKITSESKVLPDTSLRVVSVNKNAVIFSWTPVDLSQVIEAWRKKHYPGVDVDEGAGVVNFTLTVNQTFASYTMRIAEGKVNPVMFDRTIGAVREITPNVPDSPVESPTLSEKSAAEKALRPDPAAPKVTDQKPEKSP
jgi:hypothetical protein